MNLFKALDDFFLQLERTSPAGTANADGLDGTSGARLRSLLAGKGLEGWKDDKEKYKLDLINDIKTFLFDPKKWQKPWSASVLFSETGKVISGYQNIHGRQYHEPANILSLKMKSGDSPYFITKSQIAKQGGTVTDASKWVGIISFIPISDEDNKDKIKFMLPKSHSVINVDFVNDIKKPIYKTVEFEKKELNEYIEAFIAELVKRKRLPKLYYDQSDRCFFTHDSTYTKDEIHMVNVNQFKEIEGYYSTLFHEITHSTMNPARLGREAHDRANEELVAEMGAMIICSELGLEYTRQNSLAYLNSWLKATSNHDTAMITAYSFACDAAEYLLKDIDLASLVPATMTERASVAEIEPEKVASEKKSKEVDVYGVSMSEIENSQNSKFNDNNRIAMNTVTADERKLITQEWLDAHRNGGDVNKALELYKSIREKHEKKVTTEKTSTRKEILDIPVSEISTDEKRFQNRANAFSEDSANRIIKAVENGSFDWAKFDPITIWSDAKGTRWVLSGHSRLAAFKALAKTNKEFAKIPVTVFKGSEAEAIELALNSNTLATKETDAERAAYYHRMRETCEIANLKGLGAVRTDCDKKVEQKCRDAEGKNANFILNLSYLAPRGFVMQTLHASHIERENDSTTVLKTVANWIGEARRTFPAISDMHETEMAKWLLNGAYGSKKGQFRKKYDFLERVRVALSKFKGGEYDSINIAQNVGKTSFEKDWEKRLDNAKKELADAEKDHAERYDKYLDAVMSGKIDNERMLELMKPLTANVQKLREVVDSIKRQHGVMREAESRQKSLFGVRKAKKKVESLNVIELPEVETPVLARAQTNTANQSFGLAPLGSAKKGETSVLPGDLGQFLGEYDRLCYTIALKGDKGAGKSRLMFQLVNAYAGEKLKCAILSLEMSPESSVIHNYDSLYIQPKNKAQIDITGEAQTYESISNICKAYDVVAIDSWNKVKGVSQTDFDRLQKENPNTIIVCIFQSTTGKVTRGGNMVEFDAGTVIQVNKGGHAFCEKNRYAATDTIYNVFSQKIENDDAEQHEPETAGVAGIDNFEPAEAEGFVVM